jgi:hypothetical protein
VLPFSSSLLSREVIMLAFGTPAPARPTPSADEVRISRRRVRAFEFVYLLLAVTFAIPAASYVIAPHLAVDTMGQMNAIFGAGPWPSSEETLLWHMLAVGNVATLAFMCALLLLDLPRFFAVLPALVFLKGFSALFSLAKAIVLDVPGFYGVFLLDGATSFAMVFFAVRARRALATLRAHDRDADLSSTTTPLGLTPLDRLMLLDPRRAQENLRLLQARGLAPESLTLVHITEGCLRMWSRVLFRGDTVGTSRDPVRDTWRARLLAFRPLRLLCLVAERAIAPLDMSGLTSSRERIIRHLIGAHHDGAQFTYDLELLSAHPGALEELRERTHAVVFGSDPRAEYLRDLVVFEGYHAALLARIDRAIAGDFGTEQAVVDDPDITLRAYLTWCAHAPLRA